jgi:hypothetical protein
VLFQILDHKKDCVGYYANNEIITTDKMPSSGSTWEYSPHLKGTEYSIGHIYAGGQSLTAVCPLEMQEEWETIKQTLRSCLKAFRTSELSLNDNCLYDVLPEYFLFQYLGTKNRITQHVLDSLPRPQNYNFMYNLVEMLSSIRSQRLNVDAGSINHLLSSVKGQNFHRTLQTAQHICDYNPWGTVTGRLATTPNTFPILTMNKEFRRCLRPHNDWFIELDFNAAELRMLLALIGSPQPEGDIHDWNVQHIFDGELTREEAKIKTFAWLYSQKSHHGLEALYNKKSVKDKYWDGYKIETDYGRIINDVDEHHALNYIVQSTTIDMVHEQAYKVYKLLQNRKSKISFLIHDAVYIDLAEEDRYDILNWLHEFKTTRYGKFKVNASAGKNLAEMKDLRI